MKQLAAALLAASLLLCPAGAVSSAPQAEASAAVLMEKETGTLLYEQNAHDKLEPASVTKVMTLLLVVEAIDDGRLSLDDLVTVSARAASMGGSQVYLKENEQMTVQDLLKAVTVVSGNDAAVALAEHLSGSEEAFVADMNERAAQLGMADTTFLNCTGLPAAGHLTSAYDIALMSRALIGHPMIREYSTIWMDSIRNGAFQLSNTNKLIRFYPGATGLKTGSTDSAGYCLSATAERDGMELIAVVLHSPTSAQRFDSAKRLLDFGFANYTLADIHPSQAIPPGGCDPGPERAGPAGALLLQPAPGGKGPDQPALHPAGAVSRCGGPRGEGPDPGTPGGDLRRGGAGAHSHRRLRGGGARHGARDFPGFSPAPLPGRLTFCGERTCFGPLSLFLYFSPISCVIMSFTKSRGREP